MKKAPQLQILKGGGHTMGTWKGAPVKANKGKAPRTIENNEEEPMLPILLDDPAPDTKKKATGTENEDILMPTSI